MKADDGLWEAERLILVMRYATPFATDEDVVDYFDHVVGSVWFRNRWPRIAAKPPEVKFSNHQHAWANWTENRIYFPTWSRNDVHVLHELSHFCGRDTKENHGPRFRAAYLQLVTRWIGADAGRCLRHGLIAVGLDP